MTSAIVAHLWQSTLCVVIAWLLTFAFRNNAARVRYWIWFAASVKFLVPFSLLMLLGGQFSWRTSTTGGNSSPFFVDAVQQMMKPLATPAIAMHTPQLQASTFMAIVISIWTLGCAALLARWFINWLRVRVAIRQSSHTDIAAPIEVRSTPMLLEPGVIGIFRPVLLLPTGITERLTQSQLQTILAHELCHVRRRDNLTAAVHMLVEAVFWFHPLVWWIGARLVEEREAACDEAVVEFGNEPQTYAEGILKVCQYYMESKLTCVAGVSGANLRKRVEVIMRNRIADELNGIKKLLLTAITVLAVVSPIAFGLLTTDRANAQSSRIDDDSIAFDEISIRSPASTPGHWMLMSDGNFSMKDQSLLSLIAFGYNLADNQLVMGPGLAGKTWLDSVHYDIDAKKPNVASDANKVANNMLYRRMVRNLLADRFGIRVHEEDRPVESFALSRGVEDPSFVKPPDMVLPEWVKLPSMVTPDKAGISFQATTMDSFVSFLSSQLHRPVLNQTKLPGKYSFRLEKPFNSETMPDVIAQQLHLKLEAQVLPLKTVVVDDAQPPVLDLMKEPVVAAQSQALTTNNKYHGEHVNMQFRNHEIRDITETIEKISGQKIVVDERVHAQVTVTITDKPWDQILDEIVQSKGLSMRREGAVLYIEPRTG